MTRASVALVLLVLLLTPPAPACAQQLDTIRFGEPVRIHLAAGGARTANFLQADSSGVWLAGLRGEVQTRIDRMAIGSVEVGRGKDREAGFRHGAIVGAIVGGVVTVALAALVAGCGECEGSDDVFGNVAPLARIFVPPPALLGGLLGLAGPPPRWREAVLPPPPAAGSYLAAPKLIGIHVWAFAGSNARAAQVERLRQQEDSAGVRPFELGVLVDEARTGPPEVSYFDAQDAVHAAILAFWLRQVLDEPELLARKRDRPGNAHYLEVWLGR